MPTPTPIPFWTQSYEAKAKKVTAETLYNWYLEPNPQNAKYPYTLCPTPGLKLLTTVGDGPHRGAIAIQNNLYVVSGSRLYMVRSNLSTVDIGEVGGFGYVRMAKSDTKVLIATSDKFYAADQTSIVELPDRNVVGVAYQDGYGIAAKGGTQDFVISNVDDLTTWDALDVSQADAKGDLLTGAASAHRLLWLFKQETIEGWYNSGAAAFPFARDQSGFMEIGCMAPNSIAVISDQLFWLGHDHKVYTARGFQAQEVSPAGITSLIEERASPQTAMAFVYDQAGHTHYVLTFADKTVVYDATTHLWHYRKSQGLDRWRANSYAYVWKKHIVGDYANGNLYELDLDTYDDNGAEIRREAISPPISVGGGSLVMQELFVDMKMGVGLSGDQQGDDPKLILSWSDDGGETFGNELELSIGKIGERMKQARANRLGSFRERCIKIAVSDPIEPIVVGAYARLEGTGV